jgi:hypothetical protein
MGIMGVPAWVETGLIALAVLLGLVYQIYGVFNTFCKSQSV